MLRNRAARIFAVLLAFTYLVVGTQVSAVPLEAAKKKKEPAPKITYVKPNDLFAVDVSYKNGKKTIQLKVQCLDKVPGDTKQMADGLAFNSYQSQLNLLKKKRKQGTKKYRDLQKLIKASVAGCKAPRFLELDHYNGTFGEREARILLNRFAFGASPADIQAAVARGLDATVQMLTTYTPEPGLDSQYADLACDTYFQINPWDNKVDERNKACNPNNPNKLERGGVRRALEWRFAHTINPFLAGKMFMWLHDERLSANSDVLRGEQYYALTNYINILDRTARGGDYKQYMIDFNSDVFMNLVWLDGALNRGTAPNQNWGREFWELGTLGASNLDGVPNYTDADIDQAALAHSGWTLVTDRHDVPGESKPVTFLVSAYSPMLHAAGPKTIFAGTPYQAVVENANDLLEATFKHPAVAESLARSILREFVMPAPPNPTTRKLAELIRTNNYNLIPVFQTVMKSRMLFAPENEGTLIKHPIDLLMGYLRQTGMVMTPDEIDDSLDRLGQQPLQPDTVFGWNERRLSGEPYVLPWRNVLIDYNNSSADDWRKNRNYDMYSLFVANLPTGQTASQALIDRMAGVFGLSFTADQKAQLDQLMNFYRATCQDWNVNEYHCTVGQPFLYRDQFDPYPTGNWDNKLQALMALMPMMPQYRMK